MRIGKYDMDSVGGHVEALEEMYKRSAKVEVVAEQVGPVAMVAVNEDNPVLIAEGQRLVEEWQGDMGSMGE